MLRETNAQDRAIEPEVLWKRRPRLVIGLACGLIGIGLLIIYILKYLHAGVSLDRSRLTIATVERGTFTRDIVVEGQVVAAVSPTLYANASGTLELKAKAGDVVSRDQLIATVSSPELVAKLGQEEATLLSARIDWQQARLDAERELSKLRDGYQQAQVDERTFRQEFDRSRKAFELGSFSELQMVRAQGALEKSQFTLDQTRKSYEAQPRQNRFLIESRKAILDRQELVVNDLRRQVDALSIRAPVTGQIGQVFVANRAAVAKDAPLLTVVDLSALEVQIKVPESFARDLRPGMTADLEGGAEHWDGVLSGVSPEVVNGEVSARLRFKDEKPRELRQSQRLSVRIVVDKHNNVLMVDRGTFLDQEGGRTAYVVRGNLMKRVPVRFGAASSNKVEVLAGLAAGDQVVVSGTETLNSAASAILTN